MSNHRCCPVSAAFGRLVKGHAEPPELLWFCLVSVHSYISSYRYTDCSSDPADVEAHESSTTRLQKRLLCDPPYDPYVANPHADSHRPTVVKLKVYPQSIEFVRYHSCYC